MAAVTCEDDVSKLKKGKHVTDENIIKTIQAVGHCFCELRENTLGTKGHPIVGPRHTLFHWMDLMDLVANELNLKFLDVPEPAVIYHILCQVDVAPLKDEKHTYTPHRDGKAAIPTFVAPLPPAVRGSALVVVPSVSYGAGKDRTVLSR